MNKALDGKVAVITGGASGIGLAIAKLFAGEGARLGIIDRHRDIPSAIEDVLGHPGPDLSVVTADVGVENDVDEAFGKLADSLGPAAILVNCAGIDRVEPIEAVSLETWNEILRVHMTGTFLCCRRALPAMRKMRWGRIINVSSQLAHRGSPGMVAYCAAKAGILGFSRSLAYEVISDGITVNCLAPGPIDTPLVASLDAKVVSDIVAQIPAGRLGRTEEVAGAALLLASEHGAYFVGASMNMNGGHYMI